MPSAGSRRKPVGAVDHVKSDAEPRTALRASNRHLIRPRVLRLRVGPVRVRVDEGEAGRVVAGQRVGHATAKSIRAELIPFVGIRRPSAEGHVQSLGQRNDGLNHTPTLPDRRFRLALPPERCPLGGPTLSLLPGVDDVSAGGKEAMGLPKEAGSSPRRYRSSSPLSVGRTSCDG